MREQIEPLTDPLIGKDGRKLKRPAMPGAGRPLGALNKFTRDLKQAMLEAATLSDYAKADDPDTPGTLTRYCTTVANCHPELFFQAVSKLLPKEVRTHLSQDTVVDFTFRTMNEVRRAMEAEGLTPKLISEIESLLPGPINDDEEAHEEADDDRDRGDQSAEKIEGRSSR